MAYWKKLKSEFEQAEIYTLKDDSISLEIRNGVLKEMSAAGISGKSVRVVKNGKLGANFTMGHSPGNMEKLIAGAGQSAAFGPEAVFSFSGAKESAKQSGDDVPDGAVIDYARGFLLFMKKKAPSIPLNIHIARNSRRLSIKTAGGGECSDSSKIYSLHFSAPVPGGSSEVSRSIYSKNFFSGMPAREADEFISDYGSSGVVSSPRTGRMPALFSPGALFLFIFCLQEGVSGRNLYLKLSPLGKKKGEAVFSRRINVSDEPGKVGSPHARSFDDEGVITADKTVVRGGVPDSFIYDLNYGARLGAASTGNGLKSSLFSEGLATPVSPSFINPVIQAGGDKKEDIVRGLKEAVIVENVLGFHSSNYTQGHFSVQAHGFHVKNGEVRGRLEDVMIAGNIYDDFGEVPALGDRLYCTSFGHAPYMLVDGISVTGG